MHNLYLIGMRGVGKSSVGKLLAHHLKRDFFDTDEWIKNKEKKSIADLVKENGWSYFRERERDAVGILTKKKQAVISTGGGVLQYFDNAKKLKTTGKLILLTAPVELLEKRLQEQTDRPSITGADPIDELFALWKERKPVYDLHADITIDVKNKKISEIVQEIMVWTKS